MSKKHILIPFGDNCLEATMLRRVKRFSVECSIADQNIWAHTNNSGSMLGLVSQGYKTLLSPAPNPNRKLPYTLELVGLNKSPGPVRWVGVNTMVPNRLLKLAFEAGLLPWAKGYTNFTPEVKKGASRIDALLTGPGLPKLWVECKNVSMVEDGVAAFPDAPTVRGQKHLGEMLDILKEGDRAAFFYLVQREDPLCFAPADFIDPAYAKLFYESIEAGVEVYPYRASISPAGIGLGSLLPLAPKTCYTK